MKTTDFSSPTRNHISIIFERLITFFILLIGVIYLFVFNQNDARIFSSEYWHEFMKRASGIQEIYIIFLPAVLILSLTVIIIAFNRWRKTVFYIEGNDFVYKKFTMFSKTAKLSIENIASVNIEQNVYERFLKTAKVKFDINSSKTANKTDFTFVLKLDKANALKQALTEKKLNLARENIQDCQPERELVHHFDLKRSVIHNILTLPLLEMTVFLFITFFSPSGSVDSQKGFIGFLTVFALTIGGKILKSVFDIFALSDLRLERDAKSFYLSCGLLKKRSYVFGTEKINSVTVCEPLLARLFGCSYTEFAVVGIGNEAKEKICFSLMLPKEKTNEFLKKYAPDFFIEAKKIKPHRFEIFFRLLLSFSAVLLCVPFLFFDSYKIIFFAAIVLSLVSCVLSYKTKAMFLSGDVIGVTGGIFNKKTSFIKYGDIQTARVTGFFSYEKSKAARLRISILSSSKYMYTTSGWFDKKLIESAAEKVPEYKSNVTRQP